MQIIMGDQAKENLNIETGNLGTPGAKPEYIPQKAKTPEHEDTTSEMKEAEKALEKAYDHDNDTTKKNSGKENRETDPIAIDATIDNLNRPEAAAGLKNAYDTTKDMINNSDTDKNPIARGLGKFIKRLNP